MISCSLFQGLTEPTEMAALWSNQIDWTLPHFSRVRHKLAMRRLWTGPHSLWYNCIQFSSWLDNFNTVIKPNQTPKTAWPLSHSSRKRPPLLDFHFYSMLNRQPGSKIFGCMLHVINVIAPFQWSPYPIFTLFLLSWYDEGMDMANCCNCHFSGPI